MKERGLNSIERKLIVFHHSDIFRMAMVYDAGVFFGKHSHQGFCFVIRSIVVNA